MKGFKLWRLMFDTLALVSGVLIHPSLVATASAQQSKPNILFILADNVGYGDIGVYGGGTCAGRPPRA